MTEHESDALLRSISRDPEEKARLEAIEQALRRRLASVFERPSKLKNLPTRE